MTVPVVFDHFVDDDIGGAKSFDSLLQFLHFRYFPRLPWANLTFIPIKSFSDAIFYWLK